MNIINIGISYKTAPIHIREKMSLNKDEQQIISSCLQEEKSILENVLLSTCNRTEIFAVVDQAHTGKYYLKHFLADRFRIEAAELENYLEIKEDEWALHHLFLLCCGFKSNLKGEAQILGQVKRAYEQARDLGNTGSVLNHLFQQAFKYAKKIQTEFTLNQEPRSVCFQIARIIREDSDLSNKKLMIIGLGEMGHLMYKHCQSLDLKEIYLANRTYYKAVDLAQSDKVATRVIPYATFEEKIPEVDYLVSAVSCDQPIITKDKLGQSINKCMKAKWFDLGLPRNIEHHVGDQTAIKLYNVDSINQLLDESRLKIDHAEEFVEQDVWKEIEYFYRWQSSTGTLDLIQNMREKQLSHLFDVQESLYRKLPDLGPREHKVIDKHLKSLVNAMLKEPIKQTKELLNMSDPQERIQWTQSLFGLDKESIDMKEQEPKRVIKVGSRGSLLALTQTNLMIDALREHYPDYQFEVMIIQTQGDKDQKSSLSKIGGKGVFIKSIEKKLGKAEIDLAVHSCKDMPSQLLEGTCLACIPKREEVNDVLLFREANSLEDLPQGAIIGTGSLRRQYQISQLRPDLKFKDIRGNVDSRVKKLLNKEYDAISVAKAGLKRLDYFNLHPELKVQVLSTEECLPSIGQGALGLQCRSEDTELIKLLSGIKDEASFETVKVERDFLSLLEANCSFPVGGYAEIIEDKRMKLSAVLGSPRNNQLLKTSKIVPLSRKNELARSVFDELLEMDQEGWLEQYREKARQSHD